MPDCDSCSVVKRLIEVITSDKDCCAFCAHAKSDIDRDENTFYYCDNLDCAFSLK